MTDEGPVIDRAARRLHALIAELEADVASADDRTCWMELDTALHFLHASAMSLDEAAADCQVESAPVQAVAASR